jgi:hypothetical protein
LSPFSARKIRTRRELGDPADWYSFRFDRATIVSFGSATMN